MKEYEGREIVRSIFQENDKTGNWDDKFKYVPIDIKEFVRGDFSFKVHPTELVVIPHSCGSVVVAIMFGKLYIFCETLNKDPNTPVDVFYGRQFESKEQFDERVNLLNKNDLQLVQFESHDFEKAGIYYLSEYSNSETLTLVLDIHKGMRLIAYHEDPNAFVKTMMSSEDSTSALDLLSALAFQSYRISSNKEGSHP